KLHAFELILALHGIGAGARHGRTNGDRVARRAGWPCPDRRLILCERQPRKGRHRRRTCHSHSDHKRLAAGPRAFHISGLFSSSLIAPTVARRLPASSEKEDFPDKSARPALKERSPARHCRISSSTDSSRVNGTYVKQYPTRSCAETEFSEAL